MKILTELMRVSKLDQSETDDSAPKAPIDAENNFDSELEGDELSPDDDGFEDPELDDLVPADGEYADQASEEPEDPDRAGVIRYVKGAHLVYKREQDDGTYEEMWIFNSGEFKRDLDTKKAIVAGTDIPVDAVRSPDGEQELKMWTAGNAVVVVVSGLPQ